MGKQMGKQMTSEEKWISNENVPLVTCFELDIENR